MEPEQGQEIFEYSAAKTLRTFTKDGANWKELYTKARRKRGGQKRRGTEWSSYVVEGIDFALDLVREIAKKNSKECWASEARKLYLRIAD